MESVERQRIWKIPTELYLSKYGHPNGWRIVQCERDWSLRGYERGALGATERTAPKRWWEVYRAYDRERRHVTASTFPTLREARAWCDRNEAPLPAARTSGR